MIPKIIHYVWVGGTSLPRRFQRNVRTWRNANPGYELAFWDDTRLDWSHPFVRLAYEQKAWAKLADFVRMDVVREHGGIYLDTDVEVLQSLDRLLDCECFFGFQPVGPAEPPVNNAVFGAVPQHWLVRDACAFFSHPACDEVRALGTGPELVSTLLQRCGLDHPVNAPADVAGVHIHPYWVFYPYHWEESFSPSCVRPDTLAVHHWELSWHSGQASWLRRHGLGLLKRYPAQYRRLRWAYRRLFQLFHAPS